jgi:anti-anti-sigma factor
VDVGSRVCAAPPAQPPGFEAVVTGETVTVVLRGELDVTVEGFLCGRLSRIREMRPSRLVFEMAQVTYLDCASARLIAGTGGWLPAGVTPVVSRPSPIVRRVLQASGIGAFCELRP